MIPIYFLPLHSGFSFHPPILCKFEGDLLASSAHVAQSGTPSDLVAQRAEAGPGPGAVSAAFLAIYSEALPRLRLARRRPCTWPVTWRTSHSNVCKLKE